jgi:hypothetical protein
LILATAIEGGFDENEIHRRTPANSYGWGRDYHGSRHVDGIGSAGSGKGVAKN